MNQCKMEGNHNEDEAKIKRKKFKRWMRKKKLRRVNDSKPARDTTTNKQTKNINNIMIIMNGKRI